jgi:hypothetical protein
MNWSRRRRADHFLTAAHRCCRGQCTSLGIHRLQRRRRIAHSTAAPQAWARLRGVGCGEVIRVRERALAPPSAVQCVAQRRAVAAALARIASAGAAASVLWVLTGVLFKYHRGTHDERLLCALRVPPLNPPSPGTMDGAKRVQPGYVTWGVLQDSGITKSLTS